MHKKNKILILLLLIVLATVFSTEASAYDDSNNKKLFLKAGQIDTGEIRETDNQADINSNTNSSVQSVEETEKYYIVQFTGPVKEEWKQSITASGASICNYVPHNAFVFRMNKDIKKQVKAMDFVQWVGEYKPSYKYKSQLTENNAAQLSGVGHENDNTYSILLFSEPEKERVVKEIELAGGTILSDSGNRFKIKIQDDEISEIAAINDISWIEKYVPVNLNNDVAATIVKADIIHENYSLNGTGQIVAVCDTGLDTGVNNDSMHADIRGRILNITDYSDNGAADNAPYYFGGGHGTHVSGSVLGNGSMSGGQYAGTAPEATLVFQAVQDADGSLGALDDASDISVFFQDAYDLGARIHTNSWGSSTDGTYTIDSQQVDQFMWDHPDMLILFSAGNEGEDADADGVIDGDSIGSPATAKNCLTVGASENVRPDTASTKYISYGFSTYPMRTDPVADNAEGIAAFSSRGPTDDGRIKPDIVAPGTLINSTKSSLVGSGDYWYMSGTSMSTPLTAGSAAIIRQYYTDVENLSSPSAALIKATMINGAYNITPGQYGNGSTQEISGRPDYSQGWGRVDIENSIYPQSPDVIKYYDKIPLSTDESWEASYSVANGSENFRATLVWTDYPGDAAVELQLVNNLDLFVTGPDDTYYGNSGSSDSRDAVNNVEGIELLNPTAGTYTVTVTGTNVPQGPQNFSLVLHYTPGFNETPQNNSYINDNMTAVSAELLSADGINTSSINMTVDGSAVNYTLEIIDYGYKVENLTAQPYSEGQHNVSVTAVTNLSEQISYNWTFYEDYGAPVISGLVNSSSSSSVTLVWNQSGDTDHVEIWRSGTFIANSSVPETTDSGLSFGTAYNYSLKPVDVAGNIGNWTNITVATSAQVSSSSSSSSSGGGGGGGGGGGSSGEDYDNIRFKDVLVVYAGKGEVVDFDFEEESNDIDYVRYTSLKNAGKISVTIEMLKNNSAFADSPVSGEVYTYMNIWVGKTGYATEKNIVDPAIGFKVSKEWIEVHSIDPATIKLNRYSEDEWNVLETEQITSDDQYIYFEAITPGFSPFAITADEAVEEIVEEAENTQVNAGNSFDQKEYAAIEPEEKTEDQDAGKLPAISLITTITILAITCVLLRKQQN